MSMIIYLGKGKGDVFAYTYNHNVSFDTLYGLNFNITDILDKEDDWVFLKDFKTNRLYRFLTSGERITTQTMTIDKNGEFIQLDIMMIGKVYDSTTMNAFFE